MLYTIALVGGIFGALAYGTASSALAQVVTPHSLAVFGPSLALLAVLLAMQWGAYQGPIVFSVPDVAFLLGAPCPAGHWPSNGSYTRSRAAPSRERASPLLFS